MLLLLTIPLPTSAISLLPSAISFPVSALGEGALFDRVFPIFFLGDVEVGAVFVAVVGDAVAAAAAAA